MLEEPTSRPTMDFDPNPNMCPPFCVARATSTRDPLCTEGVSPSDFPYCDPAAFAVTFGLRLGCGSISLDFSSIHWSSFDFLKRQRLPSLNAGIFCSPTYLYKVSGLTPRYCDAWRIFITSRESAIVPLRFPLNQPALRSAVAGFHGGDFLPCLSASRAFGVQSIYQP